MTNLLRDSANESSVLGLAIGRFKGSNIEDEEALKREILSSPYEVVKCNLEAYDPAIYAKLDHIGLPYYVLGVLLQYRINFKRHAIKPLYHESAKLVPYTNELRETLYEMAYEVFKPVPGSFFKNPKLENKLDEDKQARLMADYICSFREDLRPNHFTYLLHYREEYVGFIAFYFENGDGYAEFAGVRPSKTPGFYIDLVRFIQNHCIENGIHWGHASGQIQNTVVHKVYQREDMVPHKAILNVHIVNSTS